MEYGFTWVFFKLFILNCGKRVDLGHFNCFFENSLVLYNSYVI